MIGLHQVTALPGSGGAVPCAPQRHAIGADRSGKEEVVLARSSFLASLIVPWVVTIGPVSLSISRVKRIYLHAISLLTVLHWPFLIFMVVMAKPIILVWLGPSWLEVVPLIRLLCIAQLSLFATCLTYRVLVAAGSVRDTPLSSLI